MSTIMAMNVDNWNSLIEGAEAALLGGGALGFDDALRLTEIPGERIGGLVRLADRVRQRFASNSADLCSIVNARSGLCREDCRFCSQSSHYSTGAPVYPMKTPAEILKSAQAAEKAGAHRFCIVTSGDALSDRDFDAVLAALGQIAEKTGLKRCASLGRLTPDRARALKDAGLGRYHHNIETAPSFFPDMCTTHSYEDKLETIAHLREAGIEVCVGGILGLGESPGQRIEFAFELRGLNPDSVPVNFLSPRPGTPLAARKPVSAMEAAKYLAIFRLIMPGMSIRLAGGRLETFDGQAALPFNAGVNALLIGDLLTMPGPSSKSDIALLTCLGFDVDRVPSPSGRESGEG